MKPEFSQYDNFFGLTPDLICISSKTLGNKIQLSFSDNGLGFDLEKVGDKLFGFKPTFHKHQDSKGIRLYLVHNHVQSIGGTIEVESSLGAGSAFIISLNA